jgi:ABC-type nitrate/sulfonate/bicarbonate transport system permease component
VPVGSGEGHRDELMTATRKPEGAGVAATDVPGYAGSGRSLWDRPWFLRSLTLVVFAGAWEITARVIGGLSMPTFADTVVAGGELLLSSELWQAVYVSNQALVIGFSLAILTGIPLGILMGRSQILGRIGDPYLSIALVMPMAGISPLLMVTVGIGLTARVILVYAFSVVVIILHARVGIQQLDQSMVQMARVFGAGERKLWARVYLPGATPAIMTGMRVAVGRAVTGMIVAELILVSVGLGGLILRLRAMYESAALYATVVVVVAEALLLIQLARMVESRLVPWRSTS